MFSVKPFKSILELLRAFPNEQSCIDHLEYLRWNGNVISPFDPTSKVYKCKDNKYRCLNTKKYFNVRTGTIFEGTKIPLQQWFLSIYLFTVGSKGISSYTLAKELNITQKTSWFLLSRIRYAMDHESFIKEMEGATQSDEAFIGGSNSNRHANKKVKHDRKRNFKDKATVIGLYKNGVVKAQVIKSPSVKNIWPILRKNVQEGAVLVSDDWGAYRNTYERYEHQVVRHNVGSYVNYAGYTTNGIEGFWSHLKKNFIGIYHNIVSKKHMQTYVNECCFRYNMRELPVSAKMDILLQDTNGKRLTYKALIDNE